MLRINEETLELEHVPLRFKIAGIDKTDDDYLVSIPLHYASQFEGHNFPTLDIFRRALMYAGVANEARYNNRPWIVQQNEISLKKCLEI